MPATARLLALAIITAIFFSSALAQEPSTPTKNLLTTEELAEGWISLFDSETLFGWRTNKTANWAVVDGVITADAGEPSLLCTTSQWGNYQLKLDFKTVDGGNSGVFLRTPPTVGVKVDSQAYEINITGPGVQNDFPTGSLVQRQKAEPAVTPSADWQTMEVIADGPKISVKINGVEVVNYTDPNPLGRGFIGLQHQIGQIQFRNIRLRPLGEKSLFNGKDLAGWNTYPDMASVFSVIENPDTGKGEINVKNGSGQLETKETFGNFTLQLEVFVADRGLNSGVFFRCIPGEKMNGYECQIQNGFLDGDRNKPADCGTGGFFRRQNARYIFADDVTWFFQTIHVDDNHMAAWVNGYQVSDWTDRRKPDKNPRRGLRLEPGTIMLQGHDPTTDISFRNLRISELPER
jgi:hypothetical protein